MPLKYKQFFGVAVLLLAAVGTVHAQSNDLSSSGVLLDRVAAVVNDGLVLRSDVEKQMSTVSARIQQAGRLPCEDLRDFILRGDQLRIELHRVTRRWHGADLLRDRLARGAPGLHAAIEDGHIRQPSRFQSPDHASRGPELGRVGAFVDDDHRSAAVDAQRRDQRARLRGARQAARSAPGMCPTS